MAHGRHIKVLGKGSPELMSNVGSVKTMLEELVGALGMRMLDKAHLYEVEQEISKLGAEPFEDEGGVTGIAVLSTSHVSIHTWPLRPFFVMDVYSCRDFDPEVVEQQLSRHLGAYALQVTDVTESLVYRFDQERPELPTEARAN
jgi:S-adenosylmethionine decarboxylase